MRTQRSGSAVTGPSLHIEWSPGRIQAVDLLTNRRVSGATLDDISSVTRGHKDALVGISRHLVFLKTVSLPKADPEDLRRILSVQIGQLFPLPSDQLAFDFLQTTERTEEGYVTLVSAVRADDLRLLRGDLSKAGIRPVRILPIALGAAAVAARAGERDAALVAEAAGSGYTLDVVQGGTVRLSRTTPDDADLAREAQRTMAASGTTALPLVIAGNGETAAAFPEARTERATTLELLHEAPSGFAFELAEDRAREKQQRMSARTRLAGLFMLAALVSALLVYFDWSEAQAQVTRGQGSWTRQQSKLRSIRDAEQAKATRAIARQTVLQTAFTTGQPVSDMVSVAGDSLPKTAWLSGLSTERGKPIQMRGAASDPNDVARFLKTLGDAGRFRDVRLVVANSARVNATPIVQFNLTATGIGNLPMPVPQKAVARRAAPARTGTAGAAPAAGGTAQ